MKPNRISQLNLESRIKELLYENKSEREIASILSNESGQRITQSSVHRYLAIQDKLKQQVVEKNDRLKAKVLEVELDTIEARHELIKEIRDLAQEAKQSGDIKTALIGLDKAVNALDSLDKRLGRFAIQPEVQVNLQFTEQFNELKAVVIGELCDNCKQKIKGRLHELAGK